MEKASFSHARESLLSGNSSKPIAAASLFVCRASFSKDEASFSKDEASFSSDIETFVILRAALGTDRDILPRTWLPEIVCSDDLPVISCAR
jgi:hypothetical protein